MGVAGVRCSVRVGRPGINPKAKFWNPAEADWDREPVVF